MQHDGRRKKPVDWRKPKRSTLPEATKSPSFGAAGSVRRRIMFWRSMSLAFAIGLGMLLLGGLFFWWRNDPDVPLIVAAVTKSVHLDDALPLPPNPFAYEDVELLESAFRDNARQHVVFPKSQSVESQTGGMDVWDESDAAEANTLEWIGGSKLVDSLVKQARNAVPGGPDHNMIAFWVSAHGVVADGRPFLLVGNSRREQRGSWVDARGLLGELSAALKAKSDECRAVLFLDAGRSGSAWDWGILDHSFPIACEQVAEEFNSNLAVILSCSNGERSWCDPLQGNSLFAIGLEQTLCGSEADTNDDSFISVGEIEGRLTRLVSSFATTSWKAPQHPRLLNQSAADWRFISPSQQSSQRMIAEDDLVANRNRIQSTYTSLHQLWQGHNALSSDPDSQPHMSPLRWGVLEKRLARCEELALSGTAYEGDLGNLIQDCKELLGQMKREASVSQTLPELALYDYFFGPSSDSKVRPLLEAPWKEKTPAAAEIDLEGFKDLSQREFSGALWGWVLAHDFDSEKLTFASELQDRWSARFLDPNSTTLLESHLLRLLTAPDLTYVRGSSAKSIAELHEVSRDAMPSRDPQRDLRSAFWIRDQVRELDRERMIEVDLMLGNDRSSVKQDVIKEEYARVEEVGDQVSSAYQLRDQMLHLVPRIAETLLSDADAFSELGGNTTRVRDEIRQSMDLAAGLSELIARQESSDDPLGEGAGDDVVRLTRAARTSLQDLQGKLDGLADDFKSANTAKDERNARQAFALLHGSGVREAGLREAMRRFLLETWRTPIGLSAASLGGDSAGGSEQEASSSQATSLQATATSDSTLVGLHPWIYWLKRTSHESGGSTPVPSSSRSLAEQGDELRQAVGTIRDQSTQVKPAATGDPSSERLAGVRGQLAEADRLWRARTFLMTGPSRPVQQLTENRFELDLRLLTLMLASRTLDEFWCGATGGDQHKLYFSEATESLFRAAPFAELNGQTLDGVDLAATLKGLTSVATDSLTLQPKTENEFKGGALLNRVAGTEEAFTLAFPSELPDGRSTVWSSVETKRISTKREPRERQSILMKIPDANSLEEGRPFPVYSFFRGLRRSGALEVRRLGEGNANVFELPTYDTPNAVVEERDERAKNIVFVLDCSISMESKNQFLPAKQALAATIRALVPVNPNVSLIMFGHRYGWEERAGSLIHAGEQKFNVVASQIDPDGRAQIVPPMRFDEDLLNPLTKNPNCDAQRVVPLGPIAANRAELESRIDAAKAIGTTPTYQAIAIAYQELANTQGHIIVLTDGEPTLAGLKGFNNESIAGKVRDFQAQALQTCENLDRQARRNGTQIRIIQYGETIDKTKFPFVDDDHFEKTDAQGLERLLKRMLAPEAVFWRREGEEASPTTGLRDLVTLGPSYWPVRDENSDRDCLIRDAHKFDVVTRIGEEEHVAAVEVEGGESLVFEIVGGRLRHRGYWEDRPGVRTHLKEVDEQSEYFIDPVRPRLSSGGVDLELVIEKKDAESFTPRPSDLWVDLVAASPDGTSLQRYSVSQPTYRQGVRVPILVCRLNDWPDKADRVFIDIWTNFGLPVSRHETLSLGQKEEFRLESIEGVTFDVRHEEGETYRITLDEVHEVEGTPSPLELHRLRVLPSPRPEKVSTTHFPEGNLVRRVYEYRSAPQAPSVCITQRKEIEEASVHARGTIRVDRGSR